MLFINEYAFCFIVFMVIWFYTFIVDPIRFYHKHGSLGLIWLIPVGIVLAAVALMVLYNEGYSISRIAELILYGLGKRDHEPYRFLKHVICTCCCGCCH